MHEGEGVSVLLGHLAAVLGELGTEDDEFATVLENLRVDFLQSIQLCHAVRSPEATEEIEDDGAVSDEVGGAGGVPVGVEEVEVGELVTRSDSLFMQARFDEAAGVSVEDFEGFSRNSFG